MLKKSLVTLSLIAAGIAAHAQAPAASSPVTSSPAASSPAKKELITRILKIQQAGIESMARSMAEQPAAEIMGNVGNALPTRVAKDRQEAVAKEIQGDVQKYLDEAVPLVQARALRIAPTSIGTLLEEKFTEDELKQVVGIIESPVYMKFQRMGEDMQKVLAEKLLADTRGSIEPKLRALEQTVAKRLGITTPAQGSTSSNGAAPAARTPAKPAAK